MSGWLQDERRIVGRGTASVDAESWYWRVGGWLLAEASGSCLMYVRDRTRRRELLVDRVLADSEEDARDERDDSGDDQNELLVSDVARLRVEVELFAEAVLRIEDELFAVFDRTSSFRVGEDAGFSSSISGEGGGDGYADVDTQLGSSS